MEVTEMTNEEKTKILTDAIEADPADMKPETVLETLDYWDSLAKLSVLAMFTTHFSRDVGVDTVRSFRTVGDILQEMHE